MNLDLTDIVWKCLVENDNDEYHTVLSSILGIDVKRIKGLYEFIRGDKLLKDPEKQDIQAYLVKNLVKNESDLNIFAKDNKHLKVCRYSYDPAKNGQNIIKHGLSFNEVMSYSRHFASLSVLKTSKDGVREIVFSDLKNLSDKNLLCFPFSRINSNSYVLNVVSSNDKGRYRMISSRQLSSRSSKYVETIKSVLNEEGCTEKGIVESTNRCVKFLEENVFCEN